MIIPNNMLNEVCKMGQGKDCCRYMFVDGDGIQCGKFTFIKEIVDKKVDANAMLAQGDNCDGLKKG